MSTFESPLPAKAHKAINNYLERELGRAFVLPEHGELTRQRLNFLEHFGPQKLAAMSGPELLRSLPYNVERAQPMDYWLEFKNDEEFDYELFGSISGGFVSRYGLWQEKKEGTWRGPRPGGGTHAISEDAAQEIVERRRAEILAAVAAVEKYSKVPIDDIDPLEFQAGIEEAAPMWKKSNWLHKYLHLVFPERVTWCATGSWSEAELYRVGVVPSGAGLYAHDIEMIRFWNSIPVLRNVPIELRYRVGKGVHPRQLWCLGLGDDEAAGKEMIEGGYLSLGPQELGSLLEASMLRKKSDIRMAVEAAFADAGYESFGPEQANLIEMLYGEKEGAIITLVSEDLTAIAVGKVSGGYRYVPESERPHQLPVQWLHHNPFELPPIENLGLRLLRMASTHPLVAVVEASLLVNKIGPWPNFSGTEKGWESFASRNQEVSSFLKRLAAIHGIASPDEYQARSYRNAAASVLEGEQDLEVLAQEGRLEELPGVGKVIRKDIEEFLETGSSQVWENLTAQYPEELLELLRIPGLGYGRVRQLFRDCGIRSLASLKSALELGRLHSLAGFGPKSIENISEHLAALEKKKPLPPVTGISRQVMNMLDRKGQVILYGPPGTGKTYHAEKIALEIVARQNFSCLPSQLSARERAWIYGRSPSMVPALVSKQGSEDQARSYLRDERLFTSGPFITTCTFHPMYSYEDFIEGYRPDGNGFSLAAGIFKQMAQQARENPGKKYVLIIDEINRGNIPKIFGELISLIEASKREVISATLPLSKEQFTVPKNLLIIATMNTADRSILLLDTALRRRFAFKELLPEPGLLNSSAIGEVPLGTWLRALNRRIVEELGRDGRNLQVGHAYLMADGKPVPTLERIAEIVRDEIWPLLQEYCYEDANKLANILAATQGGIFHHSCANLRFELFEPGNEQQLVKALIAIVSPDDTAAEATVEDESEDETEERLVHRGLRWSGEVSSRIEVDGFEPDDAFVSASTDAEAAN